MLCREVIFVDKKTRVKLVCKQTRFYSLKDENAFFEWIKKIKDIKYIDAVGDELHLYLSSTISDDGLRDILALFFRYKINMKQLSKFLNIHNKSWFYDGEKGYWYDNVFDE